MFDKEFHVGHYVLHRTAAQQGTQTMVNAQLPAYAEVMPESFLSRMSRLFAELHTVGERVGEMPDDAMDHITEAHWIVSRAIIDAPVTCEADVAAKLRHAALLVECPGGEYNDDERSKRPCRRRYEARDDPSQLD